MNDTNAECAADLGLKVYEFSDGDLTEWVVSGIATRRGKRWRRRFATKAKADEFLALQIRSLQARLADGGGEISRTGGRCDGINVSGRSAIATGDLENDVHAKRGKRAAMGSRQAKRAGEESRGCGRGGGLGLALVAIAALLALGVDRWVRKVRNNETPRTLVSMDFESNPMLHGWMSVDRGAEWTQVEEASGGKAISMQNATWVGPAVKSEASQWYRLSFRTRSAGVADRLASDASRHCTVVFLDENGQPSDSTIQFSVDFSEQWQKSDLRFRGQPVPNGAGNLGAGRMRVEFNAATSHTWIVDDIALEKTTSAEVAEWADKALSTLPARLTYRGKESRWQRLQGTIEKLRNHQKLRIVLLGDETHADLANEPIDVFLERLYPGCTVEIVPSIKKEAGVKFFQDHLKEYVFNRKADLVVIGGSSNGDDMTSFQSVVDQIRTNNALARRNTEILLLTNGWKADGLWEGSLRLASDMRELDQAAENNDRVPDDYRGALMRFAATNDVEFLDVMGIVGEFIFGPAANTKAGLQTGADGVPYRYWMRDWLHSRDCGKQIIGRIFEAYFAPSEDLGSGSMPAKQTANTHGVRLFDPSRNPRDQEAYVVARRQFGVSAVERPALALSLSGKLGFVNQLVRSSGVSFRKEGQEVRETGYCFDEPLDVRSGDLLVYWSFRADRSQGDEKGKMTMNLCFSDPSVGGRDERSQVFLTVRPGGASILGVDAGSHGDDAMEHLVEAPVENFIDSARAAKFRLLLRWAGGGRVAVDAASWNPRANRWEGFIPFDRPGAPPVVMDLHLHRHLLGATSFKSIYFETQSAVPVLEAALVTMRPSMLR